MKKYTEPGLEVIKLKMNDIISTSPGTETDILDENDGRWETGVGLGS